MALQWASEGRRVAVAGGRGTSCRLPLAAPDRLQLRRLPRARPRPPRSLRRRGWHRLPDPAARRSLRRRPSTRLARCSLRSRLVARPPERTTEGHGLHGDLSRRVAARRLLRAARHALPPTPLRLAHLGRPDEWLWSARQLPQARGAERRGAAHDREADL